MPIPVNCPCGRALNVKDELAGKKIRCPQCKDVLTVPAPEMATGPDDLILEVTAADGPADEGRKAAIQAEPPEVLPAGPRRRGDDEGITPTRRRDDERRRPRLRREEPEPAARRAASGGFGSVNAGVGGGVLMIVIAVVWFVVGLLFGRIFIYPPILFVLGIIAIVKGVTGGE